MDLRITTVQSGEPRAITSPTPPMYHRSAGNITTGTNFPSGKTPTKKKTSAKGGLNLSRRK
jgi:hypothetical protein